MSKTHELKHIYVADKNVKWYNFGKLVDSFFFFFG